MARSSKPPRRRSPFVLLAGMAALTLLVVAFLIFLPRPTVVEIELVTDHAAFTVVPPALSPQQASSSTVSLLDSSLAVTVLDVRQAVRIEATFPEGRATLVPSAEGSVSFTVPKPTEGSVSLKAPEPLSPKLTLRGPAQIRIKSSGKDQDGNALLLLWLESQGSPSGAAGWTGKLPVGGELTADLRDVELSLGGPAARVLQESRTIPSNASDLLITGGPGEEGRLGLALPPRPGPPATLLRLLDPETGDLTEPRRLPPVTAEPRFIPWGERLVLLEPDPGSAGPQPLLLANLKVRDLEFFEFSEMSKEPESSLASGHIRFPAGEREPLAIAPRSLLTLTSDDPLTLRSLGLNGGRLVLVLGGKPASLRLGPTPELQAEVLPSQFLWLYTHRISYLIYITLATVIGACLAIFKLTGLLKD